MGESAEGGVYYWRSCSEIDFCWDNARAKIESINMRTFQERASKKHTLSYGLVFQLVERAAFNEGPRDRQLFKSLEAISLVKQTLAAARFHVCKLFLLLYSPFPSSDRPEGRDLLSHRSFLNPSGDYR